MAEARASSFWQGLFAPSLASVVGAIALAVAELVACCVLVTPPHLARIRPELIAANRTDEYARITIDALRLKYSPHPGIHVIYTGPSTARLALVDAQHPHDLDVALTKAVGEPVQFHNFTADGFTVDETLVLLDYIPKDLKGVVIFTLSDTRAPSRRPKERLGLDQPSLGVLGDNLGGAQDYRTGIYFIDHLGFFSLRRAALMRVSPISEVARPIFSGRKAPPQSWARAAHFLQTRNAAIINRQVFEVSAFGALLRSRGIQFIVMEAPVNPNFEALKPAELRTYYDQKVRAFSEKWNVPYWEFSDEAGLTADDFYDAIHVGMNSARERYQAVLMRHLIEFLKAKKALWDAGEIARPGAAQ